MKNKIFIFLACSLLTAFAFGKNAKTEKYEKLINKRSTEIQKCRDEATTKTFMVSGKIFVNLEIDDKAQISTININDELTTLNDLNVQKCVVSEIKKIKFPKASQGKTVSFTHLVLFK